MVKEKEELECQKLMASKLLQLKKIAVSKNATVQVTNKGHTAKYASLPEMLQTINEALIETNLNISISIENSVNEGNYLLFRFVVQVTDCDTGWSDKFYFVCPMNDDANSRNSFNWGGTLTYAQRYIYQILLGLPMIDDDADMNAQHQSRRQLNIWFENFKSKVPSDKIEAVTAAWNSNKITKQTLEELYGSNG